MYGIINTVLLKTLVKFGHCMVNTVKNQIFEDTNKDI